MKGKIPKIIRKEVIAALLLGLFSLCGSIYGFATGDSGTGIMLLGPFLASVIGVAGFMYILKIKMKKLGSLQEKTE